jgi:hypothetical protein
MALERAPGGGGVSMADLGVSASTATLTLASGQQVPYLADAWKSPLALCRWPTGNKDLNPNGPAPGFNDPGDPQGLLTLPAWVGTTALTPAAARFAFYCHALPLRPADSKPASYRLAPLIASAGPDRKLDLDGATFAESGSGAKDNLYGSTGSR